MSSDAALRMPMTLIAEDSSIASAVMHPSANGVGWVSSTDAERFPVGASLQFGVTAMELAETARRG
jgi:hypothetical protein